MTSISIEWRGTVDKPLEKCYTNTYHPFLHTKGEKNEETKIFERPFGLLCVAFDTAVVGVL